MSTRTAGADGREAVPEEATLDGPGAVSTTDPRLSDASAPTADTRPLAPTEASGAADGQVAPSRSGLGWRPDALPGSGGGPRAATHAAGGTDPGSVTGLHPGGGSPGDVLTRTSTGMAWTPGHRVYVVTELGSRTPGARGIAATVAGYLVARLATLGIVEVTPELAAPLQSWLGHTFELLLLGSFALIHRWIQERLNPTGAGTAGAGRRLAAVARLRGGGAE